MKRRRIPGRVVLAAVWGILGVSTLALLTRAEEPAANAASARNQAFPTRSIMSAAFP